MKLTDQIVYSEEKIKEGVAIVAGKLNDAFEDAVIISVVPGGIFFTADLTRKLNFDISMDFISCPHTPGVKNNQSNIVYHQNVSINGRHVIMIDDAIESGGTMKRLVKHIMSGFDPKSVSIATLFVKPGRVAIPVPQFYAFERENDDLLVGYGLPWEDKHRNIPYISSLNR